MPSATSPVEGFTGILPDTYKVSSTSTACPFREKPLPRGKQTIHAGKADLAPVGMAGQGQVHSVPGKHGKILRPVGQKQPETVVSAHGCQCPLHPVFPSGEPGIGQALQPNFAAAPVKGDGPVLQNRHAQLLQTFTNPGVRGQAAFALRK